MNHVFTTVPALTDIPNLLTFKTGESIFVNKEWQNLCYPCFKRINQSEELQNPSLLLGDYFEL